MVNKNRDSKFIIYQVLYIFVITVLALKGANLDLSRVVKEEETVDKAIRDSLVTLLDSLYAMGIKFDVKIDQNFEEENIELKQKLASLNTRFEQFTTQLEVIKQSEPEPEPEPEKEIIEENTQLQLPLSVQQTFIQYTWNIARNTGNVPASIIDPKTHNTLAVIPPGQEKKFDLSDQDYVTVKFGTQEENVPVKKNRPPEIKIQRVTTKMNAEDIYVQELQRVTAFTVTIVDERPDQLKVVHSGPISVSGPTIDSKGNPVYNVSLNVASSESRFDEWIDKYNTLRDTDGRYKVNFFFTVVDERSKDRVQVGDSFFFTEFSR